MKKCAVFLFVFIFISDSCFSQSGWVWQNPLPLGALANDNTLLDIQNVFVTTIDGRIFKSTNGGYDWTIKSSSNGGALNDIHFFDSQYGIVFVYIYGSPNSPIIRTTNSGENWYLYSTYPFTVRKFLQFNTPNVIVANADNYFAKIVRSTNYGLNWSVAYQDSNFFPQGLCFPSALTGYLTGYEVQLNAIKIIKKTTNGGSNWFSINADTSYFYSAISFINNSTGFVIAHNASTPSALFKTTNGGANWTYTAPAIPYDYPLYFLNENTGYRGSSFFTTNGGLNWQQIQLPFECAPIYKLSFADNIIFSSGSGAYAKSTNAGLNWSELSSGPHCMLWDIKFINSFTGLAVGDNGKILRTTNGGSNWIINQLFWGDTPTSISMPTDNTWYVGDNESETGKVYKTTNAGLSWDTTYTHHGSITKIDFVNAFTGFAICKYNFFMKTIDGGNNWKDTNLQISQNWALDFADANTGLIGSYMGTYRTTDGGNTWNTVGTGTNPCNVAVQFVTANIVYASNGGLYKSSDAGLNWTQIVVQGMTGPVKNICFVNSSFGYVIGNVICRTTNGGSSFDTVGSNVDAYNYYFTDMLTGYGAGFNGTIIKTTTGGEPIGIQPISNEVPNNYLLYQNYPNPFNPVTKIKFAIPAFLSFGEGPRGRLIIYDITGREVETLLNEHLQAGTYEVEWDASNFASGVYFYQIMGGDFIQTKKMVLLK